jgi:hypothetical protein
VSAARFDPGTIASLAILAAALAGAVMLARRARRRGATRRVAATAGLHLVAGVAAAGLGVAHLTGVVGAALRRTAFAWDFRFASLLLLGLLVAGAGVLMALAAPRLAAGAAGGRRRARDGALLLLAVNAPLLPVQGFAVALAALAAVSLLALAIGPDRPA